MPKVSSAIDKGFAALATLRAASAPMTLTAIAQETEVAPSSAHSTLGQLLAQGAVVLDENKRYQLGPALHALGASYARRTPVYRAAWMELVNLANDLRLTAAIAVVWGDQHLVLNAHRAQGSNVAIPFGGAVPLAASSWGKVYYAWNDDAVPTELEQFTPGSITDRDAYIAQVEQVRSTGYAIDIEEYYPGVLGVCSAVTSDTGYVGLVSLLGARQQIEHHGLESIGEALSTLAARASHTLGDSSRLRLFGAF